MVYRGLLWLDSACSEEFLFVYHTKYMFNRRMRNSIEASLEFLKRHVFSKRNKHGRYGHHIRKYLRTHKGDHPRDKEKVLRHSVSYWRSEGMGRIVSDKYFYENRCVLSDDVVTEIKKFL